MKKQKMLITLAGLAVAVATTTTVAAYTLAGDGSTAPEAEYTGTQEPGFTGDGPSTFDLGPGQVNDDGSVSVDNPNGGGKVAPSLHGDPTYDTWLKDNPPTDDITDTPPLHGDPEPPLVHGDPEPPLVHGDPEPPESEDVTEVHGNAPQIEPLEPGDPQPLEPTPVVADPTPKDHNDDTGVVRVDPGTGQLIDPLLATGVDVKVTGEVVSEGIFSVDGRILEVNGERVQVMYYGDGDALDEEAAGISPSGSSVATHGRVSMILWDAPPTSSGAKLPSCCTWVITPR